MIVEKFYFLGFMVALLDINFLIGVAPQDGFFKYGSHPKTDFFVRKEASLFST